MMPDYSEPWSIFSDGSAEADGRVVGFGVVRRSPRGTISSFFGYASGENLSSLEAEVGAFRLAVEVAVDIVEPVVFYTDNKIINGLFNDASFVPPARLKTNENLQAIYAGLALMNQFEVSLTNDSNSSFMMFAHKNANIGRKSKKQSENLLGLIRIRKLR